MEGKSREGDGDNEPQKQPEQREKIENEMEQMWASRICRPFPVTSDHSQRIKRSEALSLTVMSQY